MTKKEKELRIRYYMEEYDRILRRQAEILDIVTSTLLCISEEDERK